MQVLASAQMLSPPEMTTLDLLAQAVAEARMIEEEQEDLLQDVEVGTCPRRICYGPFRLACSHVVRVQ